jgi:glycine dehydrogenase subunit 1
MLEAIGVASFEDLLAPMPEGLRLTEELDLPGPLSEFEIARRLEALAEENYDVGHFRSFLGGGSYDHFVPAAVDTVSSRSEYLTAYTPYQSEVAQGTLTAIFEFQTMVAELTGMDLANASLYDGATALAEAVQLAAGVTRRKRAVVAGVLHPHYLQVLHTYCRWQDIEVLADPAPEGKVDRAWLEDVLGGEPAALVVQWPSFLGVVEDLEPVLERAREAGAKTIVVFQPHALALYRTPGEMGADLAVGEGMSLGTPPTFGGPGLGLFASRTDLLRQAPGRLIGETTDRKGNRAFVMTLRTREQDIRRERATSNICTNQGLLALRATVYLSLLGPKGFREVAEQCLERAHYAAEKLGALNGFRLRYPHPFFNEFVLECPRPAREIVGGAMRRGIIPGINLGRFPDLRPGEGERLLLVCVTEKHTKGDLDALAGAVEEAARD